MGESWTVLLLWLKPCAQSFTHTISPGNLKVFLKKKKWELNVMVTSAPCIARCHRCVCEWKANCKVLWIKHYINAYKRHLEFTTWSISRGQKNLWFGNKFWLQLRTQQFLHFTGKVAAQCVSTIKDKLVHSYLPPKKENVGWKDSWTWISLWIISPVLEYVYWTTCNDSLLRVERIEYVEQPIGRDGHLTVTEGAGFYIHK